MPPDRIPEPIQVALDFVALLDQTGIPYVIVGSLASSVHGEPRSTDDIDFVLDLKPDQVGTLLAGLGEHYYASETALIDAARRGTSSNLVHRATALKLDLFVAGADPFDQERLKHRRRLLLTDQARQEAWVDLPEHILVRKLEWYRRGGEVSERQWRDVLGILRAQKDGLDFERIATWSERLGVSDLLARAVREAGEDR